MPARPRRIWVVDDSPTEGERVVRLFASEYEVEWLSDGSIALERLSAGDVPELMVLDWMMPGVTGIEVLRYLRAASAELRKLPVLLLTVRHDPAQVAEALEVGANDYVGKPFVDEELRARVKALLRTRGLIERAEQAEASLRAVLENAPDAILTVDADGRISYLNEEALNVLDRPLDEILGHRIEEVAPSLALRSISVGNGESLLPLPDVTIGRRVFSPSLRALSSDTAAATTIVLRDVTARRATEARRLDFYSIIAHDLRTPLSSMMLRLDIVLARHPVLPAALVADLQRMQRSTRSLVAMINDFLELARLEGVGHKVDRVPMDMAALVRLAVDDFKPLFDANGVRWRAEGLEQRAEALADPKRIQQVLSNLIGNAVKFTPHGGTVTTRVALYGGEIETSVEDTGPGIRGDAIPRLFDRYSRVDSPTKEVLGTGLGLMIVRQIVEAHGGTVGVESHLGEGSRFWFRLPRAIETMRAARGQGEAARDESHA